MGVEHRYIEVNGLRLHAVDFGGAGAPIVCLHDVGGHAWAWRGVAAALEGRRRLLAVDLRGHGDSQWSAAQGYETKDLALDLSAALSTSSEPVDVVGAGWGGLVGLVAASASPGLFRRLVMVDSPPSSRQSTGDVPAAPAEFDHYAAVVDWERRANPRASDATLDTLASLGTRPGAEGRFVRKHDPYFGWRWPFCADDHWVALQSLQVTALAVRGEQSHVLTSADFDRMATVQPQLQRAVIAAAGHHVALDNPVGVAQALVDFLS